MADQIDTRFLYCDRWGAATRCRAADEGKGYRYADLVDAFERYLPAEGDNGTAAADEDELDETEESVDETDTWRRCPLNTGPW
jgi:hypothetical protein